MIEDTAMGILRMPRIHDGVYPHLLLSLFAKISGNFRRVAPSDLLTIEKLTEWIIEQLVKKSIKADHTIIKTIITANFDQFNKKSWAYSLFLKIKKPKILFIEDASYGNRSFIVLPAKSLSIPVIELQHGFVNEEHIAYNLGKGLLLSKSIKKYFPDVFFAYGEFWKNSIRVPNQVISIGNPYLIEQVKAINTVKYLNRKNKSILFLSSGITVEETVDFIKLLKPMAASNGYKVVMRVHPFEKNEIEIRYGLLISLGVKISEEPSLYDDFVKSDIIIGEVSTSLFESLAVPDKKQFLLMSSYTNSYFNNNIKIPKLYKETISEIFSDNNYEKISSNYFWEQNWEINFDNALKNYKKDDLYN